MKVHLIQIMVFTLTVNAVRSTRCIECQDTPHPEDCGTITECPQDSVCYVEQYITSSGLVLYNTGCMSTKRCSGIKRGLGQTADARAARNGDIITCVDCCDGDFCNLNGCGQTASKPPRRGPICYECTVQDRPDHCRDVVQCDVGQQCALSKHHPYDPFWTSHCSSEFLCGQLAELLKHTNNTQICGMCCSTDFCNDHCT